MFNIRIEEITILTEIGTNSILCLAVKYSTDFLTHIAVIPYTHFKRKQIKEHFLIHQPLSFIPNRYKVIDEYLYMLITISRKNSKCLMLYPHQGWNITTNKKPVFICSSSYPVFLRDYLNESVKRRSVINDNGYNIEQILLELKDILPDCFEVKLMLAIRAVSLVQFYIQKIGMMPQQVFLFESSDPLTLSIVSMLLKTNNDYDTPLPTLADKPDKLKKGFGDIYDGIAITLDHANISNSQREKGISAIINDVVACNYSANAARHIQVILSDSASYLINSEYILYFHLDNIVPNHNFNELASIINMLDHVIISKYMANSKLKSFLSDITNPKDILNNPIHIRSERRGTYYILREGAKILKALGFDSFDEEFEKKLDTWFMAVDMSGNSNEYDIVNSFSEALDTVLEDNSPEFISLSDDKPIDDSLNIILHDDEYIYLKSEYIDKFILPTMKGDITHRQLIRALDAGNMLNTSHHYCCQLYVHDTKGNLKMLSRYAIKKSVLNSNRLKKINDYANEEYYLAPDELPKKDFLPLIIDKDTGRHIVRLLETGDRSNNHMLITGLSGEGKSFFMMHIAAHLAEMGEKVLFLDSSSSESLDELIDALPEDIVNDQIEIYDLENDRFPVDPFQVNYAKRSDSKANIITNTLLTAANINSGVQCDMIKTLIIENIDKILVDGKVSPERIKDLLTAGDSKLSVVKDKLLPILAHITDNINYDQTWENILNMKQNIQVFSIDAHLEKQGKWIFDLLLASFYNYHIKHKDRRVWIFIDEILDQNLQRSGIINRIFSQGRRSRLSIIGTTQNYYASQSAEWETLNNAGTKIFFQSHPSSLNEVLKELNKPKSERQVLSSMEIGECIIKSELYSKTDKRNKTAVVTGIVPKEFKRKKDIIPKEPTFDRPESIDTQEPPHNR